MANTMGHTPNTSVNKANGAANHQNTPTLCGAPGLRPTAVFSISNLCPN